MQDLVPHSVRSPEEPASLSGTPSFLSNSHVKLERHPSSDHRRLSQSSPSTNPIPPFTNTPSFPTGRTATQNTRKKRSTHPYTQPPPRTNSGRHQTFSGMSAHQYGNWSSNPVKYEQSEFTSGDPSFSQRRSSDDEQQLPYHFTSDNSVHRYRPDIRPNSSESMISSLTGAMGGPGLSTHSSPSSDRSFQDPPQPTHVQSTSTPMDWHPDIPQPGNLVVAAGIPTSYYASPTTPTTSTNPNLHYTNYNQYNTPDLYEHSGSLMNPTQYPEFNPRPGPATSTPPDIIPPPISLPLIGCHSAPVRSSMRKASVEEELMSLRNRVRELEIEKEAAIRRLPEFHASMTSGYPQTVIHPSGLPSPAPNSSNTDAFQESWDARTDARTRTFCSPNRAGNALCAWHDSRRERRAYPPRMAPRGRLNCGCTVEEALFEESLARNGVGNYHPGDSVRMDPALRNPLLKLLERRYGYKDGDFERDPITGTWTGGEGPGLWETRAASGTAKKRPDDRKS